MFADFISMVTSVPTVVLKKIFNKSIILDYIDMKLIISI
jgi:hypothetical protein